LWFYKYGETDEQVPFETIAELEKHLIRGFVWVKGELKLYHDEISRRRQNGHGASMRVWARIDRLLSVFDLQETPSGIIPLAKINCIGI
jgi:hypothetical protein